nr:MAG TPA: hypothetical protein [Bacteriophage sp.]
MCFMPCITFVFHFLSPQKYCIIVASNLQVT